METLLNYEKSVLDTRLKCEGYEEDVSAQMDDTDPAGANTGLGRREAFWNNSRVVRLIWRLHSDLFHKEKLIPAGIKLDIQLVPSRAPFFIKTAPPSSCPGALQAPYRKRSIPASAQKGVATYGNCTQDDFRRCDLPDTPHEGVDEDSAYPTRCDKLLNR